MHVQERCFDIDVREVGGRMNGMPMLRETDS